MQKVIGLKGVKSWVDWNKQIIYSVFSCEVNYSVCCVDTLFIIFFYLKWKKKNKQIKLA